MKPLLIPNCLHLAHRRVTRIFLAVALLLALSLMSTSFADAQAFEELKASEAYQKLEFGLGLPRKVDRNTGNKPKEYLSNYESLWAAPQGVRLLVQWLELRIPNYHLDIFSSGIRNDHGAVEAILRNRQRVKVTVTIQIPLPTYKTMARHKTLSTFNRYRPPALHAVGSQTVQIHGITVDYYRHATGACSVVLPTDQEGLINLYVTSCNDSAAMFEVAKALNLARLNQKLNS
jgi:hypothetical protein